jgi:methionyl-tRNA formyltransferase
MDKTKKFIYFGTPYVARDTLSLLYNAGYVPSLVVTSPDKARGRGQEIQSCETKAWALLHTIPVYTPEKLTDDAVEYIEKFDCSYALVVAYGKILPQSLLHIFPQGVLNVHYSLIPSYRGASPVETALLHGDTETGVTIQKMIYELDAGDILSSKALSIEKDETTKELRPRLIALGGELLVQTLPSFLEGNHTLQPQNSAHATRAHKIKKEEGLICLSSGQDSVHWNKYRAYAESPGTYFFGGFKGKRIRVKIITARFEKDIFTPVRVIPEGKNEQDYSALLALGFSPE